MFGVIKRGLYKWRRRGHHKIDPDEIFLDSRNLPEFDTHRFEGRMEQSISKRSFLFFGVFCALAVIVFLVKLSSLQIVHGAEYRDRSENNKLKQILIVASRGIFYDRGGRELAWNEKSEVEEDFAKRRYIETSGFSNILGFVKYPAKDKSGFYYEEEYLPKDGVELSFNERVSGKNGIELIETAVTGEVVSQNIVQKPVNGDNLTLSIDSRIQGKLYQTIKDLADGVGFQGGAGLIMDVHSGEMLAMTSFPDYSSNAMTEGGDVEQIQGFYDNPNNPFLNRAISGLYTPGSIIKPFMAFAALEENIISPEKEIVSTGKLVIPNPYFPDQPTIFKDWKAHGAVDMRKAIAVSSDVYFYQIGGGFEGQKGLGIQNIKKYLEKFGWTQKTGFDMDKEATGIIPSPEWKSKTFDGEVWRVGDTYNTAIGQYGMQITPIQAVRAVAALANGGHLLTPSIIFTATSTDAKTGSVIDGDLEHFQIAKEGMLMAASPGGTAAGLDVGYVRVAGKTGTAELGAKKQFVNSWVVGFWPYENPKYAFTVVMERGPVTNLVGGTYVMRQVLDWMHVNTPEYLK